MVMTREVHPCFGARFTSCCVINGLACLSNTSWCCVRWVMDKPPLTFPYPGN
ncbi:hypothetical protein JG687_00015549 [Phytophthora cactorum]|uniref:Uncharacterized protein n=1 Tax=Phytophthora cactorum TaxID=29920 RepID=A0A8T1TT24_9STRA|nr:hypothetical protein JG687_00015549 [Phytophthora cactorum]